MDYTIACSKEGQSFKDVLKKISDDFDRCFNTSKKITKEMICKTLLPLARFVSSFPSKNEIKGYEELFMKHPSLDGVYGITAPGLKILNRHSRAFLCRRKDLIGLKWNNRHADTITPATPDRVKRALEIALFRADASSTDELMNSARNRTIARHMPKHTLYDFQADPYVRSKDFYLAMRETKPESLNVSVVNNFSTSVPKFSSQTVFHAI